MLKIGDGASAPLPSLHPIAVGTSATLAVGQRAFAIGNPFGLDQTLTTGVVSGLGRDIQSLTGRTIRDVVQTDAAINPGNSGGPLLDSRGRLIGVNTVIYSPSGASAGVGFAIPVDTVRRVVNMLIRNKGRVVRAGLGVHCAADAQARQLGLPGVLVIDVAPGSGLTVMGRRYELVEFHFHRPSEERVNGKQFAMVAHLMHKDGQGRQAVVAVLLERGRDDQPHPVIQTVWGNLPLEKGEALPAQVPLDLSQLLPADRGYFTYMGSLTTPPCSEGVLWMVMRQPVALTGQQLDVFASLYPMNARPLQAGSGRVIKESLGGR